MTQRVTARTRAEKIKPRGCGKLFTEAYVKKENQKIWKLCKVGDVVRK